MMIMIDIKILGPGCANCKRLDQIVRKVTAEMGIEVSIVKVTDYIEITKYNVMITPALLIDEKVVSSGRIPTAAEVRSWLEEASKK
jgi:small redox-active disulfide protein 2